MNLALHPCTAGHHDACLAIFDSNQPEYVAECERAQFANFLNTRKCPYFVPDGYWPGLDKIEMELDWRPDYLSPRRDAPPGLASAGC